MSQNETKVETSTDFATIDHISGWNTYRVSISWRSGSDVQHLFAPTDSAAIERASTVHLAEMREVYKTAKITRIERAI